MHIRVSPSRALLVFLSLSLVWFPSVSAGQVQIAPEAIADPVSEVIAQGRQLETQRRWSDALSHYEEALREHPGHQLLTDRLDLAQIHYSLSRRYDDASFKESLRTIDGSRALDLYNEVLLKINTHYVHSPEWRRMVMRGTRALDVAIGEEAFVAMNLPGRPQAAIERFRSELYDFVSQRAVRTRHDAAQVVASVASLAEQRLGLPTSATVLEYTVGAAGGLDTYSAYLTGGQLRDVFAQIEGNFVGLGIELKADSGSLLIVNVIPGSPAERAGILADDRIVAVGGTSTSEMSSDQAANLLQGEVGSYAHVTVQTEGQLPRELQVRREQIEVPSIEDARIIDRDFGVAYVRLPSFQKTTNRDLDAALWQLHREGMKSLIVDLRGNPGGLLTAAVEVADKFIAQGGIVSTRGRSPQEDYNYTAHQSGTWRVPLVVLIDGDSASASEIFAGAMRDHRRGTIVGDRSYGKGSVQGIFPLGVAGAGIRLTTAKFYSPSGRPISDVGVAPNVVVRRVAKIGDGNDQPLDEADDAVLDAGVQAARQQLASR
ncbi:MAG: S41 family peptidase [Pirellulales bacterium]